MSALAIWTVSMSAESISSFMSGFSCGRLRCMWCAESQVSDITGAMCLEPCKGCGVRGISCNRASPPYTTHCVVHARLGPQPTSDASDLEGEPEENEAGP